MPLVASNGGGNASAACPGSATGFIPKLSALIVGIPGPMVAAYYVALVALLFFFGLQILRHDGLDSRKGVDPLWSAARGGVGPGTG